MKMKKPSIRLAASVIIASIAATWQIATAIYEQRQKTLEDRLEIARLSSSGTKTPTAKQRYIMSESDFKNLIPVQVIEIYDGKPIFGFRFKGLSFSGGFYSTEYGLLIQTTDYDNNRELLLYFHVVGVRDFEGEYELEAQPLKKSLPWIPCRVSLKRGAPSVIHDGVYKGLKLVYYVGAHNATPPCWFIQHETGSGVHFLLTRPIKGKPYPRKPMIEVYDGKHSRVGKG